MNAALYEDQGPPLLVQGYAAAFDRPYWLAADERWELVAPGAFDFSARPVPILFGHLPGMRYAPRARLFQDGHGLGFEFALPRTWARHSPAVARAPLKQTTSSESTPPIEPKTISRSSVPATVRGSFAWKAPIAFRPAGTVNSVVISPAPMSSASARCTASTISA